MPKTLRDRIRQRRESVASMMDTASRRPGNRLGSTYKANMEMRKKYKAYKDRTEKPVDFDTFVRTQSIKGPDLD